MPEIESGDIKISYDADDTKYFHLYRKDYYNILFAREDIPHIRKLLDELEEQSK